MTWIRLKYKKKFNFKIIVTYWGDWLQSNHNSFSLLPLCYIVTMSTSLSLTYSTSVIIAFIRCEHNEQWKSIQFYCKTVKQHILHTLSEHDLIFFTLSLNCLSNST